MCSIYGIRPPTRYNDGGTSPRSSVSSSKPYDPDRDADHYIGGAGLGEWFDILLRIRSITPTQSLVGSQPTERR